MRAVSDAMLAKIQSGQTTFCNCFRFTLNGGAFLRVTDLDRNVKIGSETYLAAPGVSATAISETAGFEPSNLELEMLIDGTIITTDELRSGKFSRAKIQMFAVDYRDLPSNLDDPDIIWIKSGTVGNIQTAGKVARLEFRGFEQSLKQNIVATGSRFCRATLGDTKCKKDLTPFTQTGTIVSQTKKDVVLNYAPADNVLVNGYLEIIAGQYIGARFDVASNSGISVKLLDLPAVSLAGLAVKSVAGCDKSIDVCHNTFNNVINFRGEPHVPTRDSAVAGKNAKAGTVSQSQSGGGK